jgi:hypothetical protein
MCNFNTHINIHCLFIKKDLLLIHTFFCPLCFLKFQKYIIRILQFQVAYNIGMIVLLKLIFIVLVLNTYTILAKSCRDSTGPTNHQESENGTAKAKGTFNRPGHGRVGI